MTFMVIGGLFFLEARGVKKLDTTTAVFLLQFTRLCAINFWL
jgi:hypothetical protein